MAEQDDWGAGDAVVSPPPSSADSWGQGDAVVAPAAAPRLRAAPSPAAPSIATPSIKPPSPVASWGEDDEVIAPAAAPSAMPSAPMPRAILPVTPTTAPVMDATAEMRQPPAGRPATPLLPYAPLAMPSAAPATTPAEKSWGAGDAIVGGAASSGTFPSKPAPPAMAPALARSTTQPQPDPAIAPANKTLADIFAPAMAEANDPPPLVPGTSVPLNRVGGHPASMRAPTDAERIAFNSKPVGPNSWAPRGPNYVPGQLESITHSLVRGGQFAQNLVEGATQAAGTVAGMVGAGDAAARLHASAAEQRAAVEERNRRDLPVIPFSFKDPGSWPSAVAQQVPQLALTMGAGVAAKSAAIGWGLSTKLANWIGIGTAMGATGALEGADAQAETMRLIEEKKGGAPLTQQDHQVALGVGAGVGVVNALLEKVPADFFIGGEAAKKKFVNRIVQGFITEGSTEYVQGLTGRLVPKLGAHGEITGQDVKQAAIESLEDAFIGGLSSMPLSAISGPDHGKLVEDEMVKRGHDRKDVRAWMGEHFAPQQAPAPPAPTQRLPMMPFTQREPQAQQQRAPILPLTQLEQTPLPLPSPAGTEDFGQGDTVVSEAVPSLARQQQPQTEKGEADVVQRQMQAEAAAPAPAPAVSPERPEYTTEDQVTAFNNLVTAAEAAESRGDNDAVDRADDEAATYLGNIFEGRSDEDVQRFLDHADAVRNQPSAGETPKAQPTPQKARQSEPATEDFGQGDAVLVDNQYAIPGTESAVREAEQVERYAGRLQQEYPSLRKDRDSAIKLSRLIHETVRDNVTKSADQQQDAVTEAWQKSNIGDANDYAPSGELVQLAYDNLKQRPGFLFDSRQAGTAAPRQDAATARPSDPRDAAIHHSMHTTAGASERIGKLREIGATDTQLYKSLQQEYGSQGGAGGDGYSFDYKGGKQPKLTINAPTKETLSGMKLVNEVRRVLGIAKPGETQVAKPVESTAMRGPERRKAGSPEAVTTDLAARLADPAKADAVYDALPDARGGKVLNADVAKDISPYYQDFDDRVSFTSATHKAASKYVYDRFMREVAKPSSEPRTVVFLAGGAGSGKTSAARSIDVADLVYDSNLIDPAAAKRMIDAAVSNGWDAHVEFIYRDYSASAEAMIRRAAGESRGRHIPLGGNETRGLASLHLRAQRSFAELARQYAGDPRVSFAVTENVERPGTPRDLDVSSIAEGGERWYSDIRELHAAESGVLDRLRSQIPATLTAALEAGRSASPGGPRADQARPAQRAAPAPAAVGEQNAPGTKTPPISNPASARGGTIQPEVEDAQPDETRSAVPDEAVQGVGGSEAGRVGQAGPGPLERVPSRTDAAPSQQRPVVTGDAGGSGGGEGAVQSTGGRRGRSPRREGDRAEGVHPPRPAGEAGPVGDRGGAGQSDRGVSDDAGENQRSGAAAVPAGNHVIADPVALHSGGLKQKFRDNVTAIETLRKIEAEGRRATADEQAILARYVGWGAMPGAFNKYDTTAGDWTKERDEIAALLSPDEFAAAAKSTLNAHYTSGPVVSGMWDMAKRMGFDGRGRVLEPSMGVGNFFGLMPADLRGASLTGVELDKLTGRIAKLLYPDANVLVQGFENLKTPHGFFDFAISNVPFGDFRVHDKEYDQHRAPIHDYFFLKTLDQVRPGGLVMYITSTGTMDKGDARIRKVMASKADLVAAIRLPEGAFSKNAGTAVVTDLIVLKRRDDGSPARGPAWTDVKTVPDPDGGAAIPINEYFADNPAQVLGTVDRKSRLYGAGKPHVSMTADFEKRWQDALSRAPEKVYVLATAASERFNKPTRIAPQSLKEGAFVKGSDGRMQRRQKGELVAAAVTEKQQKIIEGMMTVRDAMREVINAQVDGRPESVTDAARAKLNRAYDGFVKKHGPLHKPENRKAFAEDPDSPVVLALEEWDAKAKTAKKSDAFHRNTVRGYEKPTKAADASEAVGISLNETGRVDVDRIASLVGRTPEAIGRELIKQGLAFEDPASGWQSAEQYLSGNVRRKLIEAQAAAKLDEKYRPNIAALEKVQPADVPYDEIDARLGVPWVGADDIAHFAADLFGSDAGDFAVKYISGSGEWLADWTGRGASRRGTPNDTQIFGTGRAPFMDVLEAALNNKVLTIRDKISSNPDAYRVNVEETAAANQKADELQQRFRDWIWQDDARRERLHRYYNDTFNNIAPVRYDGAHLKFPGMSPEITLREHQRNAVWRVIVNGTALLGHEVGTGKTWTMGASAMELRRLGLARKPAISVLKSTLPGFLRETRELYPNAKILAVDKFEAKDRKGIVSQIATGDWDLVILTHDHLDMLPMKVETQQAFIQREIDELENVINSVEEETPGRAGFGHQRSKGKEGNRLVKKLEKAKARLEARLKEALDGKQDDAITFEETGIDQLFVDEAHKYKSLPVYTKQDRIKGIPTSRSNRATNMQMRAQWLQELNNGRGVVFATGTPITNTMAELYTMMRYLQGRDLAERGIEAFDAWARNFGIITTRMEYGVTGEYAPVSRFSKFVNLPELGRIAGQVIDVQRAKDMPNLVRPNRKDIIATVPMTAAQKAYLGEIRARAVEAKKKKPGEPGDNMLSISGDARKSALDMRLVDSGATGDDSQKTAKVIENVLRIYKEDPTRTQMIFSDIGIHPTKWGYSPFREITQRLIAGGIPAERIINFSELTDAQKRTASQRLKQGDASIGLGSTDKMGTGVNAQDHLYALHNMDVPWLPGYVEQRDGRGWRQGNRHPQVQIYRYTTEGSFDTFMWQAVDAKTRFINQFIDSMSAGSTLTQRSVADQDTEELTPAQIMAVTSGNPLLLDKINLDRDVAELEGGSRRHERNALRLRDTAKNLDNRIREVQQDVAELQSDLQVIQSAPDTTGEQFTIQIGRKEFTDREEAAAALLAVTVPREWAKVGKFRGLDLWARQPFGNDAELQLGQGIRPRFSLTSLEYAARPGSVAASIRSQQERVAQFQKDATAAREEAGKPFPRAADLKQKKGDLESVTGKMAAQSKPGEAATPQPAERDNGGSSGSGGAALYAPASSTAPFLQTSSPQSASVPSSVLRPVPLIEMIRFSRTILGDQVPQVRQRMKALGYFKVTDATGRIRIRADQAEDARQLAGVVAHEIGHSVDFLPQSTLKRGNALGRIASLRNYLRHSIAATPGGATTIKLREIRKELLDVSEWWRGPIVGTGYSAKYRRSSKELYADALSVLLNSPGDLQQRAPTFFSAFLAHMEAKPEVRQAYLDVQDVLAGTPEQIAEYRRQDVREMFAEGEDIWKARRAEIEDGKQGWPSYLRQLLFDKSIPVLAKQKQVVPGVVPWDESLSAKHTLEELNMTGNALHLWAKDVHEEVTKPLTDAGLDRDVAGEYLFMTRVAFGDRGGAADAAQKTIMQTTGKATWAEAKAEFAPLAANDEAMAELLELAQSGKINPKGYTPESAKAYLDDMKQRLGPQKYQRLEELMKRFRDMQWAQVQEGVKAGTYNREMVDNVLSLNKDFYAPFAVLKYLDTKVKAGIFKQIGTFEDIANPFDAALLKTMSVIRLNELQKAKREVIGLLRKNFADEIGQPQPIDKFHRAKPPGQGRENLVLLEDGKPVAYEVDDYVAKVFSHHDVGALARVGRWISSKTYGVFHPLWISFNIGWQLTNVPRDFFRTYTNSTILSHRDGTIGQVASAMFDLARVPAAYLRAVPVAVRRARGIGDAKIRQMLEDRALDTPFIRQRPGEEDDQYERFLMETGVWEKPSRGKIIGALAKILDGVETVGTITETIPKVAMFDMATRAGLTGRERAYVVRNYAGTPNTKRKGLSVDVHNALWTYSNVILQGYRADAEVALNPKTAGGRWLRAALINYIPKTVMIAAVAGLFGEWLKDWFEEVPEYDKTKYIIIPLGRESESGKPVYLRLPHNDTDRVFAAVYWKLFSKDGADGTGEAIGIAAGEFPGLNPYVQMINKWTQYASGQNPRDDFRGRDIIGRDEQLVGGWERLKPMLLWTTDQFGAPGQYVRAIAEWNKQQTGGPATTTEKIINTVPGLHRLLKVSDRGAKESEWKRLDEEDRDKAELRLSLPENVRALMKEKNALDARGLRNLSDDEVGRFGVLQGIDRTYQKMLNSRRAGKTGEVDEYRKRLETQAEKIMAGDETADPRALQEVKERRQTDAVRASLPSRVLDLLTEKNRLDALGVANLDADERKRFVELRAIDREYGKLLDAERMGRTGEAKVRRQRLEAEAEKVSAGEAKADPRKLSSLDAREKVDAVRDSLPFEVRELLERKSAIDSIGSEKLTARERLAQRQLRDVEEAYEKLVEAEQKGQPTLIKARRQMLERTAERVGKLVAATLASS